MGYSVFPERLDKLDTENTAGSLTALENYLNYMQERVEFSFTNMYKTVQGAGITTAEMVAALAALSNNVSAMSGTVNQLQGTITGIQTTVGGHTTAIANLQSDLSTLSGTVSGHTSSIGTMQNDLTALQGTVGGHTTELGSLDGRVDAIEAVLESAGPILYQQPADVTAEVGTDAVFSVRVLGSNLSYAWKMEYGSDWITPGFSGVNTAEMTVPVTTARNGYRFRCTITGGGWTIVSRIATLHVTS